MWEEGFFRNVYLQKETLSIEVEKLKSKSESLEVKIKRLEESLEVINRGFQSSPKLSLREKKIKLAKKLRDQKKDVKTICNKLKISPATFHRYYKIANSQNPTIKYIFTNY